MTGIRTLKAPFDRLNLRAYRIPTSASWRTTPITGLAATKKLIVIATASTTGRKVREKVPASALVWVVRLVCLPDLVCLPYPVWGQWLPPAGLQRPPSVPPRVPPPEGSWEL